MTVVSNTKGGSGAAAPTGSGAASTPTAQVPVSGASINKKGSVGGMAAAAAMVAIYML